MYTSTSRARRALIRERERDWRRSWRARKARARVARSQSARWAGARADGDGTRHRRHGRLSRDVTAWGTPTPYWCYLRRSSQPTTSGIGYACSRRWMAPIAAVPSTFTICQSPLALTRTPLCTLSSYHNHGIYPATRCCFRRAIPLRADELRMSWR